MQHTAFRFPCSALQFRHTHAGASACRTFFNISGQWPRSGESRDLNSCVLSSYVEKVVQTLSQGCWSGSGFRYCEPLRPQLSLNSSNVFVAKCRRSKNVPTAARRSRASTASKKLHKHDLEVSKQGSRFRKAGKSTKAFMYKLEAYMTRVVSSTVRLLETCWGRNCMFKSSRVVSCVRYCNGVAKSLSVSGRYNSKYAFCSQLHEQLQLWLGAKMHPKRVTPLLT